MRMEHTCTAMRIGDPMCPGLAPACILPCHLCTGAVPNAGRAISFERRSCFLSVHVATPMWSPCSKSA
eukprot:9121726-Lingulodinium_polyedra.AAC.1